MRGIFLDSNVLLYLLSSDANKADVAEALLNQSPTISVQVLNEITSVCLRKFKMPWSEITDLLQAVKATCRVVPLTVETHAQAVRVAQQHHLSFCDAHIVAAAISSGASTLMSEDMHAGLTVLSVRIQNPFATPH
jgi:predicted nucleic acid-binding protein